ncbi:uncharacterized protein UDID_18476 [Ustilago sp. UG-2017a]|nr:uncharacterized protein UDID_18476 [Ustilago sp. UG-2017a]
MVGWPTDERVASELEERQAVDLLGPQRRSDQTVPCNLEINAAREAALGETRGWHENTSFTFHGIMPAERCGHSTGSATAKSFYVVMYETASSEMQD